MSRHQVTDRPGATGSKSAGPAHPPPGTPQAPQTAPRTRAARRGAQSRTRRAVLGWASRLVRRGVVILTLAAGGYMALEVATFEHTYPNGISAEQFAIFVDNPAARMLQGVPHGLDSAGGYAIWDGGWVLSTILAVWGLLVVSRLLRGEEESERAELLLVGPLRARQVTTLVLGVVTGGAVVIAVGTAAGLILTGADALSALVYVAGLAGFTMTIAGTAALASQVVDVRRRAAGLAAAALGVAFMVRMVANSTDERAWIGWLTPYGWMDKLQAFSDPDVTALAVLIAVPAALMGISVWIRQRRDTGGALLPSVDRREAHLRGLGGPTAYAWRSNQAVLVGWVVGLGAYAFMLGSLLTTVIDFIAGDADYRRLLDNLGFGVALSADGFLGVMSVTLGVGFALYAAWRMGAARAEEESERAENFLARPVTRGRWLGGHIVLTLVSAALLVTVTGLLLWVGAAVSGSEDLTLGASLRSVLNTGSIVVLVIGVAVLTFGLAPRLTTVVPVSVTVAGYLLAVIGPALSWPDWVLDLSPFTHLAYVPAEAFAPVSATVMVLVGMGAAGMGVMAFRRRDLAGA